jgi:predicted metal-dependent phosphotriesterase family hydrolase
MKRRNFIHLSLLGLANLFIPEISTSANKKAELMTVKSLISQKQMGVTLPHEHILVDFIGADQIDTSQYDYEKIYEVALPFLQKLKAAGCQTLIECTPNFLGRSPLLFKRLADATGLHIITNTGLYGAVDHKFLPEYAKTETAQQLSERWLKEWTDGIDNTNIRPGFMKISVGDGPISDLQKKLVEAAALTHLKSGLTIASHTGGKGAILEQLEIIKSLGVHPSAFVWVHAQNEENLNIHLQMARAGVWVEFDGLYPAYAKLSNEIIQKYLDYLGMMKQAKLLHRTLLSQDSGWYNIGQKDGGNYLPYHLIFSDFLPKLDEKGFTKKEVNLLLKENPYQAFAIRVRRL